MADRCQHAGEAVKFTVDVDDSNRIELAPWGSDGALNVGFYNKLPSGQWVLAGGCVLPKGRACGLGIALLNKSGNQAALMKKHRWEE